jgi:hypothetical protein
MINKKKSPKLFIKVTPAKSQSQIYLSIQEIPFLAFIFTDDFKRSPFRQW